MRNVGTFKSKKALTAIILILAVAAAVVVVVRHRPAPAASESGGKVMYQCPMHPQIIQDHPGSCPICHMDLEKTVQEAPKPADDPAPAGRKVLRYQNPMDATKFSEKPMKDSMGMDYIPVYEEEAPLAGDAGVPGRVSFTLPEERRQLIGVKTGVVEEKDLKKTLRLPGRAAGGKRVTAELLEIDAGVVRAGMRARLKGPQGEEVAARVSGVDGNFDALTRSFAVSLQAREAAAWLKPGVYTEVTVEADLGRKLAVPVDAVLMSGERKVVFVFEQPDRFLPREVKLGQEAGEDYEVLEGLKAGEKIVTSANFLIDSESRFKAALSQFSK